MEPTFTSSLMQCKKNDRDLYDCYSDKDMVVGNVATMVFSNLDPTNMLTITKRKDPIEWNLTRQVEEVLLGGGNVTCAISENDKYSNFIYCDAGGPEPEEVTVNDKRMWCLKDKLDKMACVDAPDLSHAKSLLQPGQQLPQSSPRRRRRS